MRAWHIGAAMAGIVVSYGAGRAHSPVRTEVVTRDVHVAQKEAYAGYVSLASVVGQSSEKSAWKTRRIYYPSGTIVIEAEGSKQHARMEAKVEHASQEIRSAESRTSEHLHSVATPNARERWSIGAFAYHPYQTPQAARLKVGFTFERRLFGGIWTGVALTRDYTALTLKVQW